MKKPKMPRSFQYYSMRWTINPDHKLIDEMGLTERDHAHISITNDPRIPDEMLRETLLHELLHVVLDNTLPLSAGLNNNAEDIEENLIRVVSPRLFHLFNENPELLHYIFKPKGAKK